jgi:hypothetical protein
MPAGRVAHFLLFPKLFMAPWNEALLDAYAELGFEVDLFSGPGEPNTSARGNGYAWETVEYGKRWLLRNAASPKWRKYDAFSGTSENPLAVVGILAALHRRASIAVADEIKSGSYAGNTPASWKRLCRWALRGAGLSIVNDDARIPLLREYAGIPGDHPVVAYPSSFRDVPVAADRAAQRAAWGVPDGKIVVGSSGVFTLATGADWIIEAAELPDVFVVVQPTVMDGLTRYCLERIGRNAPLRIDDRPRDWRDWWSSAAAMDIGVVVYRHNAPQFQNMGVSSNRLCMFLAMGVPVIASRQPSLEFIEEYDCGVLVDDAAGFKAAVRRISARLPEMRVNARQCWREHVAAGKRYDRLVREVSRVLS